MVGIRDLEKEINEQEIQLKKKYQKMEQAERNHDEEIYNYWSKEACEIEHTIQIYKYLKEKYCE